MCCRTAAIHPLFRIGPIVAVERVSRFVPAPAPASAHPQLRPLVRFQLLHSRQLPALSDEATPAAGAAHPQCDPHRRPQHAQRRQPSAVRVACEADAAAVHAAPLVNGLVGVECWTRLYQIALQRAASLTLVGVLPSLSDLYCYNTRCSRRIRL